MKLEEWVLLAIVMNTGIAWIGVGVKLSVSSLVNRVSREMMHHINAILHCALDRRFLVCSRRIILS
jgi:hypothetical protein